MSRTYALLIGINEYPPGVRKLEGCVNDVDHFHAYLRDAFKEDLAVEILKDGDATRDNVIRTFRSHLGKAGKGDVAIFHYCGHGARATSAKEFREFYPIGKDEGLVCVDSRNPGGFDLADKELAILIAELGANDPHIAMIMDCCHSGSATRGADELLGMTARTTDEVHVERPLETYLDNHYARQVREQGQMSIPSARHILLAACQRDEKAKEAADKSGVFTSALLEVLGKSADDLTYSDLFVRCRAAVRKRADDQNPQFETARGFNAQSGFLGRQAAYAGRRFSAYFDQGGWQVECGAIHGVPTDAEKPVALALYPESDQAHSAGTATAVQVGPHKSRLSLDFAGDESVRYRAEITSLPVAPMPIAFDGPAAVRSALQAGLEANASVNASLSDSVEGTDYALAMEGGSLTLKQRHLDLPIQGAAIDVESPAAGVDLMLPILKHVSQWERSLALQNRRTQMDPSLVDLIFAEQLDGGSEQDFSGEEVILDYAQDGGQWKEVRGRFKLRNRTQQPLHILLVYFSQRYGIHILKNDPVEAGDAWVTIWGDQPNDYFYLPEGKNETIEIFKLIVSTEKVDDFLVAQEGLELGRIVPATREIGTVEPPAVDKIVHQNEWFTRDCRIRVVRRLDRLGRQDIALAEGKILVKGHPSITANLSLGAAKSNGRSAGGGADFYRALERQGMEMLNFAATRGADESILELTDIQNGAALKSEPLEIQLNAPLAEDEEILPLVFDGRQVLLGGDTARDGDGNTRIVIDQLFDEEQGVGGPARRGRGGSLKLYFFKTHAKLGNLNQLRWVDHRADDGASDAGRQVLAAVGWNS